MNKKINVIIPVCIAVSILYIFLAVRPLSKEIHFKTLWTTPCTRAATLPGDTVLHEEDYIPFKLGQTAGYFTEDGTIVNFFSFPYKATLSQKEYALFGTSDSSIQIFSNKGEKTTLIKKQGFPFFQDGRKYLMLPGGLSFAKLNDDGTVKFSFENYVPITAFSSSKSATAAGFADGTVIVFNNQGEIDYKYIPGGSTYDIILGTAVSDSGVLSACVSGHDKQRFVIAKKESGHSKIIFHQYLEEETNRQLLIKFSKDESKCFFEFKDHLGIVDCKTKKVSHIPVKGHILAIQETEDENTVFVLSKKDNTYSVHIIEKFDRYTGCFSFKADNAFITVKNNSLFVGRDSSISRIDISHK